MAGPVFFLFEIYAIGIFLSVIGILIYGSIYQNTVQKRAKNSVMLLAIIPMTFISILNSKFLGRENSKQVLWGFSIRFGIFLVLLVVLGSNFGLIGLSLAIVISYSIQAIILFLMFRGFQMR